MSSLGSGKASSRQETGAENALPSELITGIVTQWVEYLVGVKGVSEHTRKAYESDVCAAIIYLDKINVSGEPRLDALISLRTLRAWLAGLLDSGASRSTISRKASAMRAFTHWAHRRGYLPTDPAANL